MSDLVLYTLDKITGKTLGELLKHRDLNPLCVSNIEQLIDEIRFGRGEVFVLDFSSMNSLYSDDINDFFEIANEISIIILTPYGINEKELERFRNEKYHLLVKPICSEELAKLIHKLLKN